MFTRFGRREILQVQILRHRQGHRKIYPELERYFGNQPVGSFGERRHDGQAPIRITLHEFTQKVSDALADLRHLRRYQVTMTGDRDNQRQRVFVGCDPGACLSVRHSAVGYPIALPDQ